MTQWHYRKSGVLVPCESKSEALRLAMTLLPDLIANVRVEVIEQDGQFGVNQSITYLTHEGAVPYDVPVVPKQTQ